MSNKKKHNEDKPKKEGLLGRIFGKGDETKSEQQETKTSDEQSPVDETNTAVNDDKQPTLTRDDVAPTLTQEQVAKKPKNSFSQILENSKQQRRDNLRKFTTGSKERQDFEDKIKARAEFEEKLKANGQA